MILSDLLKAIKPIEVLGRTDVEIHGLHFDSRKIGQGDLFVAQVGTAVDGHTFIDGCVANGAAAVVLSDRSFLPKEAKGERREANVTYILVENTDHALGLLASKWFGEPSKALTLVGVTGTNGKTTIATLLYKLVRALGHKAGLLSTVVNYIEDEAVSKEQSFNDDFVYSRRLSRLFLETGDFNEMFRIRVLVFTDEYSLARFPESVNASLEHQVGEINVVVASLGGLVRRVKVQDIVFLEVDVEHTGDFELQSRPDGISCTFHLFLDHLDSLEILDLFDVSQILELVGVVGNLRGVQDVEEVPQRFASLEFRGQGDDVLREVLVRKFLLAPEVVLTVESEGCYIADDGIVEVSVVPAFLCGIEIFVSDKGIVFVVNQTALHHHCVQEGDDGFVDIAASDRGVPA